MENVGEFLIIGALFTAFSLPFIAGGIMFFSHKNKKVKKA